VVDADDAAAEATAHHPALGVGERDVQRRRMEEVLLGGVAHPLLELALCGLHHIALLIDEADATAGNEARRHLDASLQGHAVVGQRAHVLEEQVVGAEIHPRVARVALFHKRCRGAFL
jgi:hypothetical protein